ncbi:hypothetical protein VTL71DRAFT_494 [Oculimacula yallundae]|uniref:Uncharacterized protein n=1 Tax=Oculimacula yallundae TaxID=86028 RepID=A0ABR4D098_9HELO
MSSTTSMMSQSVLTSLRQAPTLPTSTTSGHFLPHTPLTHQHNHGRGFRPIYCIVYIGTKSTTMITTTSQFSYAYFLSTSLGFTTLTTPYTLQPY